MGKHLERDLEQLQEHVLTMAGWVEEAVHQAVRALQNADAALAREVIQGDDRIDDAQNYVDDESLRLLALHQPVAHDLRRIAAVLQMSVDLERMGDLADKIAERAIRLAGFPALPAFAGLQPMADVTTAMARQSLDAFVRGDTRLARRVIRLDDEVDRLNDEVIGELVAVMRAAPERVEPRLSLFSAVRQLERIADHATNIAEDVVYPVEGEIIRHRPAALARGGEGG
jgi:phosphate transport system protein